MRITSDSSDCAPTPPPSAVTALARGASNVPTERGLSAHVGRTQRFVMGRLELLLLTGITAVALGCDAMIHDYIVVTLSPSRDGANVQSDTIDAIHDVLEGSGFRRVDPRGADETWTWDRRRPGLEVVLQASSRSISLRLSQNLLGPWPPRADFDAARSALVGMLRLRLTQDDIKMGRR